MTRCGSPGHVMEPQIYRCISVMEQQTPPASPCQHQEPSAATSIQHRSSVTVACHRGYLWLSLVICGQISRVVIMGIMEARGDQEVTRMATCNHHLTSVQLVRMETMLKLLTS